MRTRREMLISTMTGLGVAALGIPVVRASDWRSKLATLNFGVVSSENEADRIVRYKTFTSYMERRLQVAVKMHQATDYAGTIEALKARKLEFARFGPAAYAQAWLITGGKVEPIVVETDSDGSVGYHAVVVVKADSPYTSLDDLQGKSFAYADPNSTSGFVAPSFFLREAGIDPGTFFGRTGYSGSHENSIIAILNGTYDAAATWWTNEGRNNVPRMEGKGMIPAGQTRVIWKSPRLPGSPWAIHTDLPAPLKAEVRSALLALPTADPQAWKDLTDGKNQRVQEVTQADYEPICPNHRLHDLTALMGGLVQAPSSTSPNLRVYPPSSALANLLSRASAQRAEVRQSHSAAGCAAQQNVTLSASRRCAQG